MSSSSPTHPTFHATLRELPMAYKLLFTAALMTLACGYLFALTNLALAIGLHPAKVMEHYWGNKATQEQLQAQEKAKDAPPAADATPAKEEAMSFDDLDKEAPSEPILAVPSFPSLVAEGHFHLFGFTFIFFLLSYIISFAELRPWFKYTLILAPFAASIFDTWSTLLTRFIGPYFAFLLIVSGSVMGLSFAAVFVIALYQMWFRKAPAISAGR